MKDRVLFPVSFCCLSCLLALLCVAPVNDVCAIVPTAVAPNETANVEGNADNAYPFALSPQTGPDSMRYMQVYNASQFASIGSGGFITQIIFRPDAGTQPFSFTLSDIQINLSTTQASADHFISSTFADNVGSDDTIVYARGPLTLSSAATGPAGGPKDFDILINLTTPFFYNPQMGNLLLDVRNFSGTAGVLVGFDAQQDPMFVPPPYDGVSRLYTLGGNVNSASADAGDSLGLVTGFNIVPEPGSVALLLAGGAILLAWSRRRRQFRQLGA